MVNKCLLDHSKTMGHRGDFDQTGFVSSSLSTTLNSYLVIYGDSAFLGQASYLKYSYVARRKFKDSSRVFWAMVAFQLKVILHGKEMFWGGKFFSPTLVPRIVPGTSSVLNKFINVRCLCLTLPNFF